MVKICIISSSVRSGRNSHRVALYLKDFLLNEIKCRIRILDLKEYNFPLFDERLRFQELPTPDMRNVSDKIKTSDGVIIITPEYNGGYPASLKNLIDLLYDEWHHKPVGIVTVSDGSFGGSQVLIPLQFTLWKIKALTVTATFPVPDVINVFNDDGIPFDKKKTDRRAGKFINEFLWFIEASRRMTDIQK